MKAVGLIGWPVAHSASPKMQAAAFAEAGLDWRYELWPTPAEAIPERIARLRSDDALVGCNVTVPHKQAVMPHIDEISAHARAIGAVNTIVKHNSRLTGHNTDWLGFIADLAFHGVVVNSDTTALVLGAGGSARGVVYGLLRHGATVRIVNRSADRARALAAHMAVHGQVEAHSQLDSAYAKCTLIVNCTAAGMEPDDDATPWPEHVPFPPQATLYDLVYKPRVTKLMRQAGAVGARAISGIGMLAEQGAAAFELWTGIPAARVTHVMRAALASS